MSFTPLPRSRLAEQVAAAIRDAIVSGGYRSGESLPGERELADQFGVNRSSVREALHRLDAWGLVEVRHGGATRVADLFGRAGVHLLPYLLAPGGAVDPRLLRDVLELRVVLMGWSAAQAARRATPESLATIRAALDRLDAASTIDDVQTGDYDVFAAMVAATGNRVLGILSDAIRRVYLQNGALFAALYGPGALDTTLHHRAVEAIAAGDAEAARVAMEAYASRSVP